MGTSISFPNIQLLTIDTGEQSVGKSYALNHFVDTSFAGSAMRCTEGAWLSLTPTEDELIVALDFEGAELGISCEGSIFKLLLSGIHSIERSAQEDMLLVLFNVALSNLVSLITLIRCAF